MENKIKIYIVAYWDHWCGYKLKRTAEDFCCGDDTPEGRKEVAERIGLSEQDAEFVILEDIPEKIPGQYIGIQREKLKK